MSKKPKTKERIITINAELSLPLGELAIYTLKKGENESDLLNLLFNKPEVVNTIVRKIINEILKKKKTEVKLKELKFDYNDSDNFSHGASYFKITLRGTKKGLRKISGENKLFFFDWDEYEQNTNSEKTSS